MAAARFALAVAGLVLCEGGFGVGVRGRGDCAGAEKMVGMLCPGLGIRTCVVERGGEIVWAAVEGAFATGYSVEAGFWDWGLVGGDCGSGVGGGYRRSRAGFVMAAGSWFGWGYRLCMVREVPVEMP
jgi:hypothetical protein